MAIGVGSGLLRLWCDLVRRALLHEASGGVGNTALHWAAAKGHAGCVRLLLQEGAPLEQLNAAGGSALHSSAVRFLNHRANLLS